ncbi:MAG: DNA recombination protein RmuC [Luteitalea sp.]|nr:DNA recombination protein RmuC [Luteitalea sp.]
MTDPILLALPALLVGLLLGALAVALFLRRAAAAEARAEAIDRELRALEGETARLRERLSAAEQGRVVAETRMQEAGRQFQQQERLLEEAKSRLGDAFKSLAADALDRSTQGLLQLAEEKFKALREQAAGDLTQRTDTIAAIIAPLRDAVGAYQKEARDLAERSATRFGGVDQQLQQVMATTGRLSQETSRLVNALRQPHVRGRWGEIALRRTAELAGMIDHCDFTEQESLFHEDGRLRPDMIVTLPADRRIVVDSKVPLTAYLESLEAASDEARRDALRRHALQVRHHVTRLGAKDYAETLNSLEFVVLFIPNDSFLAAAAEEDPDLIEWALAQRVVIATPTTFIALLRAVAYGWRQERMAENAEKVSELGRQLSERMSVLVDHLAGMGGALGKAVEAYNRAVGSLESRVLPSARKFDELGAAGKRTVAELEPIESAVRSLSPAELQLEPSDPQMDSGDTRIGSRETS